MRIQECLGVAQNQQPRGGEGLGYPQAREPLENRVWSFGERCCSEQGWADQKSLGQLAEGAGSGWGRLGQTLSKRGLWIDGCVALQGDTIALGAEVVSGDNAHSDNQQGPGRRGPGHCGLGTASGTAHGTCGSSKENSSPPVTPISAHQAHKMHTQAGLDAGVPTRLQGVHRGGGEVTAFQHCISPGPEGATRH